MPNDNRKSQRHQTIRVLFDEYIELYASRDDRLTTLFSDEFTGYTGGGRVLVTDKYEWINITRQDFSEVPGRVGIELHDIALQDLSEQVVSVTAFFTILLPIPDHFLSQEIARLQLIFRFETDAWKIVHSGISVPYHLVQEGEVYPLRSLAERNQALEALVEERTRTLNEREEFYRLLTEDTLDVLWQTDANLGVTYVSPSDERLRGYAAEEVVGHHVFELFTEEGVAIVSEALKKRFKAEQAGDRLGFVSFEAPHRCKDGRVVWGEVFSKAMRDEHGKITGFHGITREITERKKMQDQIKQLAFYDSLTQLPNRRLLFERLNRVLVSMRRSGKAGALMFVDLDDFKPLNDQHGHAVGDLLLIEVAARLKSCVREMDSIARFGGDEFVVLLSELVADYDKSVAQANLVAEKIRVLLSEIYTLNATLEGDAELLVEHHCSASIGVFVFQDSEQSADNIINNADKAMYQAKAAGKNKIRFYQEKGSQ